MGDSGFVEEWLKWRSRKIEVQKTCLKNSGCTAADEVMYGKLGQLMWETVKVEMLVLWQMLCNLPCM